MILDQHSNEYDVVDVVHVLARDVFVIAKRCC